MGRRRGVIDVAVGAIILAWPDIGLVTLAVFFAITMLVRGMLAIVLGFQLRSLAHHPDAACRSRPRPTPRADVRPRSVSRPSPRGERTA